MLFYATTAGHTLMTISLSARAEQKTRYRFFSLKGSGLEQQQTWAVSHDLRGEHIAFGGKVIFIFFFLKKG